LPGSEAAVSARLRPPSFSGLQHLAVSRDRVWAPTYPQRMSKPRRRPFSYANVAATLALVFSMCSGALAAKHYLISSTSQIKPSLLKKLVGKVGKTGPVGAAGIQGPAGVAGKEGPPGREGVTGLTSGEVETLHAILPHTKYVQAGIGGKPTIQFSGVNVQVINGATKANGEGNLVIGYDAEPGEQTGSHNLVLGAKQTFTGTDGIIAGYGNSLSGIFDSILGGEKNSIGGVAGVDVIVGGASNSATNGELNVIS